MRSSITHRLSGLAVLASLVAVPTVATAPAEAASLSCRAHMQDATPAQYTYDHVYVHSATYTRIHTVAHYKSSTTDKYGRTNSHGNGATNYYLSGATAGYRVYVDVYVTKGSASGHCRTSFVPHS